MERDHEFYNHKEIEPKWQGYWAEHHTFKTGTDASKPKFYALDMFPYPSGAGLHVGHPEGYTATDILSRFKRAQGYNVLHPMGWDAFGLPAEQYAMDTGNDPAEFTAENIANFNAKSMRLDFLMTGIVKSIQQIQTTTSGRNGFSLSFTKKVWPMKRKYQ